MLKVYTHIPKRGPKKVILHMSEAQSASLSRAIYKAIGFSTGKLGVKDTNTVMEICDDLDSGNGKKVWEAKV